MLYSLAETKRTSATIIIITSLTDCAKSDNDFLLPAWSAKFGDEVSEIWWWWWWWVYITCRYRSVRRRYRRMLPTKQPFWDRLGVLEVLVEASLNFYTPLGIQLLPPSTAETGYLPYPLPHVVWDLVARSFCLSQIPITIEPAGLFWMHMKCTLTVWLSSHGRETSLCFWVTFEGRFNICRFSIYKTTPY